MTDDRLYGLPGAEHLHLDLASAYEEHAAYYEDEDVPDATFEEWSIRDPRPDDNTLRWWLESLAERAAEEGDEDYWGEWEAAVEHKDVWAAFRAAADLAASKIAYRMADEHLGDYRIVHIDGQPHIRTATADIALYGARRG